MKGKEALVLALEENAERKIQRHLPSDFEIDDIAWGSNGFRIPVFNAQTIESYNKGSVAVFYFFLYDGESDREAKKRFNYEVQKFIDYDLATASKQLS